MAIQKKILLVEVVKSSEFKTWCNESLKEVFDSLFAVDIALIPIEKDAMIDFEISGIVAFMTDDIEAILQLSCSQLTIFNLSKSLSGDPIQDQNTFLCVGEAVNIVFGMLKEKMNFYDLNYEKCLPLVILGQNHVILNLNKSEAFNNTYRTPYGLFNLKVGFSKKFAFSKAS